MSKIQAGVVGLGNMGGGVARNLCDAGVATGVWDVSDDAAGKAQNPMAAATSTAATTNHHHFLTTFRYCTITIGLSFVNSLQLLLGRQQH